MGLVVFMVIMTEEQSFNKSIHPAARFQADNWNKLKNLCSKQIGEKMKVINRCILRQSHVAKQHVM